MRERRNDSIKNHNHSFHRSDEKGFTLVEMAISIIIIGILASSAFYAYSLYLIRHQTTSTLDSISNATTALQEFKNTNGRYPCPAPILESKNTSAHYGHETDCNDPMVGTTSVVPPGKCTDGGSGPQFYNGICIESSNRTILGVNPRVRMGALPFRDMQMDEKYTFDGYGSRLVYVVTEDMAVTSKFKDTIAGIEIRDEKGNLIASGEKSVGFLIFSPGKNKNGAVNTEGVQQACNDTLTDGQNCRVYDGNDAMNTQAVYTMDAQSLGTSEFDDVVEYFVPSGQAVWRRESRTSENMIDMSEDKVGVGIQDPTQLTDELTVKQSTVDNPVDAAGKPKFSVSQNLQVANTIGGSGNTQSGGLRVGKYSGGTQSGKILADKYCDEVDSTKCFETKRITGTYDNNPTSGTSGMGCAAGEYMIGIEGGKAKCSSVRIYCPPGQAFTGIGSSGQPLCTTPLASCSTANKTICGQTQSIAAGGNGQTRQITYTTNGACAYTNFTCSNGTWVDNGGHNSTTYCTYNSATPPTGSYTGLSCGTGYTGTYTQNYNLNCAQGVVYTTNTFNTTCTCQGISTDVYCPSSYTPATKIGTQQRTCTNNTLNPSYTVFTGVNGINYTSVAAMQTALCSCGLADYWDFAYCGSGKVRKASPNPASFSNPIATWPSEYDKGGYRKRTVSASCAYDNLGYDVSNCECASGYNWRDQTPSCNTCQVVDQMGKVRQIRSGSGCSWVDDTDTSANTVGTCKARAFLWKNSGVSAGPPKALADGHGINPVCDSSCDCGESGTATACAASSATQWQFFKATCQPQ